MNQVELSSKNTRDLTLLASAWGTDIDGAVARLIGKLADVTDRPLDPQGADRELVSVHAVYAGHRSDGIFDPRNQSVRILNGPGEGSTYDRPSAAAIAVVRAVKPEVNPNRNGWNFWTVTDTGQQLQSIRHRRR